MLGRKNYFVYSSIQKLHPNFFENRKRGLERDIPYNSRVQITSLSTVHKYKQIHVYLPKMS